MLRVMAYDIPHNFILAVALTRHQSSNFILRTSTIIFMMKIMIKVPNILLLLHRDAKKRIIAANQSTLGVQRYIIRNQ